MFEDFYSWTNNLHVNYLQIYELQEWLTKIATDKNIRQYDWFLFNADEDISILNYIHYDKLTII
jgi:hypothetical protein